MNYFKQMPIGRKLVLAFTLMIVLAMAIGFVGSRSAGQMARNVEDIFTVRLPAIDFLIEADRDLQQLLVAERSLLMADPGSDLAKKLLKEYEENLEQAGTRFGKYKALAENREEAGIISEHEKARDTWKALSRKVVDLAGKGTPESRAEALALSLGQTKQAFEDMREHINALTELNLKLAEDASNASEATYGALRTWILAITALGILAGILLILWLAAGITKPLRRVIAGITEGANQVSAASGQISESGQNLASGASEQAASIEEISSSLEEISSMTKRSAENSHQADALTGEAKRIMAQALEAMGDLTASMGEITQASEETSKIIKTIDEIAFQTNLLALNAAVEAARAGEAGAGFAVVADEVRNLAMRAAAAAKNTSDLIEGTMKKIHSGAGLSSSAVQIFKNVSESTDRLAILVGEVAGAAHEQAKGIEQVNSAVQEMNSVTQQNAANAEESASASEEMNAQAEQMKGLIRELAVLVDGTQKGGLRRPVSETLSPKLSTPSRKAPLRRPPQKKLGLPPGHGQAATPQPDDAFEDF